MGCNVWENPRMGLHLIADTDGQRIGIIPV